MPEVELFHWNPNRPVLPGRLGRRVPLRRTVNNFGDLLGPAIVRAAAERLGLDLGSARRDAQLLSIGSVLHFAREGAVIWGSGVNGKIDHSAFAASDLDVRAVRGPLTRDFLLARGIDVPPVFGDPGLLVGELFADLRDVPRTRDLTVVMNLNDPPPPRSAAVLDPRRPLRACLETIAASRFVAGSSLHGIVVAEALGVPARLVRSQAEDDFKYRDYYLGTGRPAFAPAATVAEAVERGGEQPPEWSAAALLGAFPADLWDARGRAGSVGHG